jgi:hypothetical protein
LVLTVGVPPLYLVPVCVGVQIAACTVGVVRQRKTCALGGGLCGGLRCRRGGVSFYFGGGVGIGIGVGPHDHLIAHKNEVIEVIFETGVGFVVETHVDVGEL